MTESARNALYYVLLTGIFIVPFLAFVVPGDMFFPYITGKNFLFRILAEILFAVWLMLAIADRRFRPVASPVLYAVAITVAALAVTSLFGANPYRSFWSNYERMEGLIGHLHLFAYFLVLTSVMGRSASHWIINYAIMAVIAFVVAVMAAPGSAVGTLFVLLSAAYVAATAWAFMEASDWRRLLYAWSAAGWMMAVYGLLQHSGLLQISLQSGTRVDGTFGNATYMAIFMVFSAFVAIYLLVTERRSWFSYVLAGVIVCEAFTMYLTATRGAILGLMGGFALLAALNILWNSSVKAKKLAALALITMAAIVGSFLLLRNTDFVTQNSVLSRFSGVSIHERTVESRLTIWQMSFEGFKERPIFGWGIENYNQVFNKYFNPVLWKQEPWFDRSHDVIFDWLIAGGLLGLLSYLSIFAAAVYMLWKRANLSGADQSGFHRAAIFTALLGAYFAHNLFVFDNLISYLFFFTVLGFIHFSYTNRAEERDSDGNKKQSADLGGTLMETVYPLIASGVFVALVMSLYFLNVKPILANYALLGALQDINTRGGNVKVVIADFEKVFSYDTFGSGEAREQLAGYAGNVARSNIAPQDKAQVLAFAAQELEKQIARNPNDPRGYIFLSTVYDSTGHNNEAMAMIGKAIELSPKKQQLYFLLADQYMSAGDYKQAIKIMRQAYELDPTYDEAVIGLVVTQIVGGEKQEAESLLTERFGSAVVADKKLINAYAKIGDYGRVRDIWLLFTEREPENFQNYVNLAATYLQLGERARSVAALAEAIRINPQFKTQGEYYIGEIKAGRNP